MDNLFQSQTGDVPDYLLAADSHNVGNTGGGSWFDPDTWSTKFSNAGKFIAVSALSGADSLYNSATTVGSWAGVSEGPHDTGDWISSLDDDLGSYYKQNREAADLVGFVATSFIPGLAGVKFLNAGQTALKAARASGLVGANLSRATGLLVPEAETFVKLSAQQIAQSSGAVSLLNANTIKALGAGFTQNVLEAAAFETAAQATLFASPVLQGQDGWDIAKNIAFGGVVGGAIGGGIAGAINTYGIKSLVKGETAASKLFSSRVIVADITPADQKIILTAESRDMRPVPIELKGDAYPLGDSNSAANNKLYASSVERDNNAIRTDINSLVRGGDGTVGNMVADALHGASAPEMMGSMLHANEIGGLAGQSLVERAVSKAVKALDIEGTKDLSVRYVKLVGEGAGDVTDSAPIIQSIADTVQTTRNRSVRDAVLDKARGFKFNTKEVWDAGSIGGATGHLQAEARYIWAQDILPEVKAGTVIHSNDIPLLERVRSELQSGNSVDYKIQYPDGSTIDGVGLRDLESHLQVTKLNLANDLLEKLVLKGDVPVESGTESIAKIVNVKRDFLEGTQSADITSDLYAHQSDSISYHNQLVSKGLRSASAAPEDTLYLPKYAKVSYKTQPLTGMDGNIVDGMVWLKQQQRLFQDSADRIFAKNAGGTIDSAAPELTDNVLINANLSDGGAGLVSFANGGYGSLGSYVQQIGANVTRPLKKAYREATAAIFESPLVAMGNKRAAAIEFDVINQRVAATSEHYVIDDIGISGSDKALVPKKLYDWEKASQEAAANQVEFNAPRPKLQAGAPESILVTNDETFNVINAHIQRTGARTSTNKEINAALGKEDTKDLSVFRPIRPNPNDYKFLAFVKDDKVTGAGHTTMIHARSESELRQLTDKVPTDQGYKVIFKSQAEDYYKAHGEYEYSRTLNENYIDSDLASRGINSQFFPKTDPQKIVDDILQSHLRADDVTAVELVRMKYQPAFDWLEDQGKQFTSVQSSQYGSTLDKVEKFGKNPYTDYTKTALDVSKASEYSLLHGANRALDQVVSDTYAKVSSLWARAKTPAEMDEINSVLQGAGYNGAYYDAATDLLANHPAPKGVLSKFIRTSNSILSRFTLALDPLNGLNNAIGANILRSTELKQLTRAIGEGNAELAGQLAGLSKIVLPGTTDQLVTSPAKLLAQATKNFFQDDGTLLARYQSEGLVKDTLNQFREMMDDFTLRGTETAADLDSRIASGFAKAKSLTGDVLAKGEVLTGNKFFEQMNRFLSADVMRQITDLGEQHGLFTAAEAKAYRNTFVNRVEGNTIASQRPVIFQGPIGQAVGLFQSYQFNFMQQLFRYVGEGTAKDAAMLLGLQGTMYGINGLPAFNAINTHIVGNLSGNKNHTDLYDATYGIAGKTAGDFLMYGIPSSIIQTNLYSRGDINPRSLTILPSTIADVPIVSAYAKLFSSLYDTTSKIRGGGNLWESILQGVEHNGISRPLAGLAQDLQATTGAGVVFSTSSKGSILGTNDFLSLASLSRLAGGRPLDEAIINDGVYRIAAYEAAQTKKREALVASIKTQALAGGTPGPADIDKFSEAYAATGGKQSQFNKFVLSTYTAANTSQSQRILHQLSNPFNRKMQILMGGRDEASAGKVSQPLINPENQPTNPNQGE